LPPLCVYIVPFIAKLHLRLVEFLLQQSV